MRRLLPLILSGALGLNAWAILVCLPALHLELPPSRWTLCALPLVPLLVGAACTLGAAGSRTAAAAPSLLLLVFPASLLLPLAGLRELTGVNVYGFGNLIVAAAALCAHGAGALVVLRRLAPPTPHRTSPIQGWALEPEAVRRARARTLLLVSAALVPASTFTAAFLRPGLEDDLAGAYGKSAPSASVGVGAAALAIAVGVLLVYFAPPLRRPTPEEPIPRPARRLRGTVLLLLLAAAASLALVLMRAAPWQ